MVARRDLVDASIEWKTSSKARLVSATILYLTAAK